MRWKINGADGGVRPQRSHGRVVRAARRQPAAGGVRGQRTERTQSHRYAGDGTGQLHSHFDGQSRRRRQHGCVRSKAGRVSFALDDYRITRSVADPPPKKIGRRCRPGWACKTCRLPRGCPASSLTCVSTGPLNEGVNMRFILVFMLVTALAVWPEAAEPVLGRTQPKRAFAVSAEIRPGTMAGDGRRSCAAPAFYSGHGSVPLGLRRWHRSESGRDRTRHADGQRIRRRCGRSHGQDCREVLEEGGTRVRCLGIRAGAVDRAERRGWRARRCWSIRTPRRWRRWA